MLDSFINELVTKLCSKSQRGWMTLSNTARDSFKNESTWMDWHGIVEGKIKLFMMK